MAILDPPSSILDLAIARLASEIFLSSLQTELFQQPVSAPTSSDPSRTPVLLRRIPFFSHSPLLLS